jgi:DDE family transposase
MSWWQATASRSRPSSAANVNDTMLFPALLRRALVVCTAIARLYADAAYHSAENRRLCVAEGILPLIRERGEPHRCRLGTLRCVVEHANAWLLANKRLDRGNDRVTNIIDALLTTACIVVIANRLTE